MSFDPLFDPDATPEETDALRERVRRDPDAAETAAKLLYVDGLLWASVRRKTAKRRRWVWIAAAATVAAATLGILFWPGGPVVVDRKGSVTADRNSVRTSGEASAATVVYPDGTRLEVGGETEVRDLRSRPWIEKGTVRAVVRPREKPLAFVTPHGEARVLGTTLRLAVGRETRLDVEEGRVEFRNLESKTVIVTTGHYAVAAAGAVLVSKQVLSAKAAPVEKMASRSWIQIPATAMVSVAPDETKFPKIHGGIGFAGITESWSGAVLDTRRDRLVVWGGGASNYYGNEVVAFDLATMSWARLTEPSPDVAFSQDAGPDGRPTSRSTYHGLAYVAHADRMFSQAGSLAGGGGAAEKTWMFDFGTASWSDRKPNTTPGGGFGSTASYDAATRKIWYGNAATSFSGLWSYDVDANLWTRHNTDDFSGHTGTIDTKRGRLVLVGRGQVFAYDLRGGAPKKETWTTIGGEKFIAGTSMGLEYVASLDRIFGWFGGAVFELNLETKAWTVHDVPGAPEPSRNGIFGRWRWVPSLGAFVVVTRVGDNVHFYKP